jgi:hypothetical protein
MQMCHLDIQIIVLENKDLIQSASAKHAINFVHAISHFPTSSEHLPTFSIWELQRFMWRSKTAGRGGVDFFLTRVANDTVSRFADRTCKITISGILNPLKYCVIFIVYVCIRYIIYKCSCDLVPKIVGPPPARELYTPALKHLTAPMERNG